MCYSVTLHCLETGNDTSCFEGLKLALFNAIVRLPTVPLNVHDVSFWAAECRTWDSVLNGRPYLASRNFPCGPIKARAQSGRNCARYVRPRSLFCDRANAGCMSGAFKVQEPNDMRGRTFPCAASGPRLLKNLIRWHC